MQPLLEESPELRLHSVARARRVRGVVGVVFAVVLVAGAAWLIWYGLSVHGANTKTQGPMRTDKAATSRLEKDGTDLTLLVIRPSSDATTAVVAVMRQPEKATGTWLLALPHVPLPTSDAAGETPSVLRARGRATLMKAVEQLIGSKFQHYIEVDGGALASVMAERAGLAAPTATSVAPTSAIAAVANASEQYQRLRTQSRLFGVLEVPALARALSGLAVSDLSVARLDTMLRRLGTDAAAGRVQVAVVPATSAGAHQVLVSTPAAIVLATRMRAGHAFGKVGTAASAIVPGTVSVSVLNGAGREGVAAQASRILKRAGYPVKTVGNANQFVYDRTLVVYDTKKAKAEAVQHDLRLGKVVASRGMYLMTTDVLVIVGGDWPQTP